MLKRKYIQKLLIAMAGILLGFSSCDEPFKDTVFKPTEELSAADWITRNPDYSDWVKVLNTIGRLPAMNDGTKKNTFFVVKNDALNEYARSLTSGTYNSIHDLSKEQLNHLVKSHSILKYAILSKNMSGRIGQKTSSGNYLTVAFDEEENLRYVNNGPTKTRSYLIEPDVEVINGYIQVLSWPIVTEHNSIWTELKNNENYTIFCDLLQQTGDLHTFLDREKNMWYVGPDATPDATEAEIEANVGTKEEVEAGLKKWREYPYIDYKTVFVIPNSVFLDAGFDDGDAFRMEIFPDDVPSDPNSDFYDFMRYHIINRNLTYEDIVDFPKNPGGAGYLKQKFVYPMSKAVAGLIAVEDQDVGGIFLNPHSNPVQIDVINRNIPTSNGYIHEIDDFMYVPVTIPVFPQEVEFTDPIQFTAIDFYRADKTVGSAPENFYFYSGNVPGITWSASVENDAQVWYSNIFMQYVRKKEENRFKNFDGIFWNLGSEGTIIFDMPAMGWASKDYDLWIESAIFSSSGGVSRILWGDSDGGGDLNHRPQEKDEDTQKRELVKVRNKGVDTDRALRLLFSVKEIGQAGVDRAIIVPRP